MASASKARPPAAGRPGDEAPLGDTAEHSGATGEEGRSEGTGGARRPRVGDPGPEAAASGSEHVADRSR